MVVRSFGMGTKLLFSNAVTLKIYNKFCVLECFKPSCAGLHTFQQQKPTRYNSDEKNKWGNFIGIKLTIYL